MPRSRTLALVAAVVLLVPGRAMAQAPSSVVVDESTHPLPGATVSLLRDGIVIATTVTNADGAFAFESTRADDLVEVSLSGFQTLRVPVANAARITLKL